MLPWAFPQPLVSLRGRPLSNSFFFIFLERGWCVIPKCLQKTYLKTTWGLFRDWKISGGTRDILGWPQMNCGIMESLQVCHICQNTSQMKQPILVPRKEEKFAAWSKAGISLFSLVIKNDSCSYLYLKTSGVSFLDLDVVCQASHMSHHLYFNTLIWTIPTEVFWYCFKKVLLCFNLSGTSVQFRLNPFVSRPN